MTVYYTQDREGNFYIETYRADCLTGSSPSWCRWMVPGTYEVD